MKRWLTPLAVALCALALSSCTLVATNAAPVRIAKGKVPFSLLSPTIPGTNHARVRFQGLAVYFVDATNNLTATTRIVPFPPVLSTVIEQLILGPTAIERESGYTSDLPKKLVLVSASVKGEIGYVNLATPLSGLSLARSRFSRWASLPSPPTKSARPRGSSSRLRVSPSRSRRPMGQAPSSRRRATLPRC